MFQKHKRESSPDSIGEPINEGELIEVQMKQRHPATASNGGGSGGGGKSINSLDYNSCDLPSASVGRKSSSGASPSSASAAATTMAAGNSGGCMVGGGSGGGSISVVSMGCNNPNSSTSSVVVNLPTSYPNSEMDYSSASYPPSPSLSTNNDKPQVRITFL